VRDHASAAREPDPGAVDGAEARVHPVELGRLQWLERTGLADRAQRPGVLGQEDVGAGPVALLEERCGQLGAACVARLDANPGLRAEAVEKRADQCFIAAAVDRHARGGGGRIRFLVVAACDQPRHGEQADEDQTKGPHKNSLPAQM
jgi:hypothetical protein